MYDGDFRPAVIEFVEESFSLDGRTLAPEDIPARFEVSLDEKAG